MNMLKSCYNPKVIAALVAVGAGIFIFAPGAALSALPVLLVLACPLSMFLMPVLMGRQMGMGNSQASAGSGYTCPMHSDVQSAQQGRCPKCGMPLVPAPTSSTAPALTREEQLSQLEMQMQQLQKEQSGITKQIAELREPAVQDGKEVTPTGVGR